MTSLTNTVYVPFPTGPRAAREPSLCRSGAACWYFCQVGMWLRVALVTWGSGVGPALLFP